MKISRYTVVDEMCIIFVTLVISPPLQAEDKHSSDSTCWEALSGFVRGLLQNSAPIAPPSFFPRHYTTADTFIYYANVFAELRKVGPMSQIK